MKKKERATLARQQFDAMLERIGYAQEVRDTVEELRAVVQRPTRAPTGSAGPESVADLCQLEQLLATEGMDILRQLRQEQLESQAQQEKEKLTEKEQHTGLRP